ncbi:MAG: Mth938-like domain-containing protein [Pseudomonadota bacterium]
MKMNELDIGGAQPPIDGYAPSGFRIGGAFFEGALLLSEAGVARWLKEGAPTAPSALTAEAAAPLIALNGSIDVLLLGFGSDVAAAPQPFRAPLTAVEAAPDGFGVDIMSTPAACRTYNVLLAEGRRVAAALLPTGGA